MRAHGRGERRVRRGHGTRARVWAGWVRLTCHTGHDRCGLDGYITCGNALRISVRLCARWTETCSGAMRMSYASASAGGQANRVVIDWRDPKYHTLLIPPHELAAAHGRAVPADAHGADGRRARAPRSPLGVAVQHARAAHLDALHDARARSSTHAHCSEASP